MGWPKCGITCQWLDSSDLRRLLSQFRSESCGWWENLANTLSGALAAARAHADADSNPAGVSGGLTA